MEKEFDFSDLRIENACPMMFALLKGEKAPHYYCGSCKKNVIDFTDCSQAEIEETIKNGNGEVCGIFYEDQLQGQHKVKAYRGLRKVTFYALVVLALIGFNVSPMEAKSNATYEKAEMSPPEEKEKTKKEKKRRKKPRRRRGKRRRYGGCPVF